MLGFHFKHGIMSIDEGNKKKLINDNMRIHMSTCTYYCGALPNMGCKDGTERDKEQPDLSQVAPVLCKTLSGP